MMKKLHDLGFKVMLWTTPFVHRTSKNYRELAAKGLLVKDRKTGKPAGIKWWNGVSGVLDLTNPGAAAWYKKQLTRLVEEYGADGFKFDAGDSSFYKSNTLAHDRNANGNDQSEAFARIGLDYPLNEYRACWKMGGRPLGQRLRDKRYSYAPIRELIPGMCMLGIMGHPFACPDMIGGGEYKSFKNVKASGNFDQELIVRSAQTHALMPMMQFSVAPWRILDKKHLAIVKKAAELHTGFAGEYIRLARKAAGTGEPIIRYMEYEFPHQGFLGVKDQFMIGKDLLVAPVMHQGARKRKIKFPKGTWKGDDGSVVEGPKEIEVDAPLERLPYYRKKK
jgi:alpha-glucosidase